MRHIEVNELWLQEALRKKRFTILKVSGLDNTADIGTKHVPADTLFKHTDCLNIKCPKD